MRTLSRGSTAEAKRPAAQRDQAQTIDMRRVTHQVVGVCVAIEPSLLLADYVFNYLDVSGQRSIRRISIRRSPGTRSSGRSSLSLVLRFGCWAVAEGLDFLEGLDGARLLYRRVGSLLGVERYYGVTHGFKLAEEMLEMIGTTLLWAGFLRYLSHTTDGVRLQLVDGSAGGQPPIGDGSEPPA